MIVTLQLICQICVRLYLPVRLKTKAALEDIKNFLTNTSDTNIDQTQLALRAC